MYPEYRNGGTRIRHTAMLAFLDCDPELLLDEISERRPLALDDFVLVSQVLRISGIRPRVSEEQSLRAECGGLEGGGMASM